MVADNWMKKNPFISSILTILLTALVSLAIVKVQWTHEQNVEYQKILDQKANIEYVDEQNNKQDARIGDKADKSLVESMDKKLDLILREIRN